MQAKNAWVCWCYGPICMTLALHTANGLGLRHDNSVRISDNAALLPVPYPVLLTRQFSALHAHKDQRLTPLLHPQVDVFSFGVLLWELVTLEPPRRGNLRELAVPKECPAEARSCSDAVPNPP